MSSMGMASMGVAILALVFAMAGGAWALNAHSSHQAQPRARSAPHGLTKAQVLALIKKNAARGPVGPSGPKGDPGAPGAAGVQGPAGPWLQQVPSNETLTGTWGTSGGEAVKEVELSGGGTSLTIQRANQVSNASISFGFPVSPTPTLVYVANTGSTEGVTVDPAGVGAFLGEEEVKALCPGAAGAPTAEPGFLCVYPEHNEPDVSLDFPKLSAAEVIPREFGVSVPFTMHGPEASLNGSWAVTAK